VKRWPLFLIASPAAVAIWSGWVALGSLCGFGLVQPFPGIVAWRLDTAITLPIGVEAYGAYALGAWLSPGTPERARKFARRSAIGSLALGMAGQVIYHLLAAAHATRAPWPVVVVVACMPVMTLGFGAALTHLLRVPDADETAPEAPAEEGAQDTPAALPEPTPDEVSSPVPSDAESAALIALRATLAAGNGYSNNQLMTKFRVTRQQAAKVRELALAEANGHHADDATDNAVP
jgi:hypothetical protein